MKEPFHFRGWNKVTAPVDVEHTDLLESQKVMSTLRLSLKMVDKFLLKCFGNDKNSFIFLFFLKITSFDSILILISFHLKLSNY